MDTAHRCRRDGGRETSEAFEMDPIASTIMQRVQKVPTFRLESKYFRLERQK
jgi:hypothetical protein